MHAFIRRARAGEPAERGFYMVFFAITIVTLTAFAGLALEYNRWQNIATRAQKAADAAALAGAVFMPDNVGSQAFTTALAISSRNGFTNGVNGVAIATAVGRLPNQLKVTVSVPTNNPWGGLVGYGATTIVRSATAEYELPQNLGSPQNIYGNDPESAANQPQFWGNVFGPSSNKDKGDAIQSKVCPGSTDNCASSNTDYDANGYFYGIDVPAGAASPLNVQVFDPAFVHVGDQCGTSDANAQASLTAAATLTAAQIPGYSGSTTPAVRYAPAGSSAFCSGDNYYGDGSNTANPWTVWTLRAPDINPWDPTNNPIVCQAEFPGIFPEASNDQPNGTIDSQHLKALLQQSTNYPGVSPAMPFNQFFRQWTTICNVSAPVQGTYFLQVETAKKIDGTATPNGGGSNRFSMRMGLNGNFSAANGLRLYGNGKMGVYANATGADTRFYLTRVLPGEAGHTLILQFFDTGDASQAGTLTVLPPAGSNVAGGLFTGCNYTQPPGNATGPPWGTLITTNSGCNISGVTNTGTHSFNGQWVTFEVPIPNDYTCNSADPLGCWTHLEFSYPTGTSVSDTTTWEAFVLGDPVRLIQ